MYNNLFITQERQLMTQTNLPLSKPMLDIAQENNFLDMHALVKNIYSAAADTFTALSEATSEFDSSYTNESLYISISREAGQEMTEQIIQEEFISSRIIFRYSIFDILVRSLVLDEYNDPLALSVMMEYSHQIDLYWENHFPRSFVGALEDRAIYVVDILQMFRELIPGNVSWQALAEYKDYAQASQTIAE